MTKKCCSPFHSLQRSGGQNRVYFPVSDGAVNFLSGFEQDIFTLNAFRFFIQRHGAKTRTDHTMRAQILNELCPLNSNTDNKMHLIKINWTLFHLDGKCTCLLVNQTDFPTFYPQTMNNSMKNILRVRQHLKLLKWYSCYFYVLPLLFSMGKLNYMPMQQSTFSHYNPLVLVISFPLLEINICHCYVHCGWLMMGRLLLVQCSASSKKSKPTKCCKYYAVVCLWRQYAIQTKKL